MSSPMKKNQVDPGLHEPTTNLKSRPTGWSNSVTLRDGATAQIRAAGPDDVAAWRTFYAGLTDRTVFRRLLVHPTPSDPEVDALITVGESGSVVIVAEADGALVGMARSDPIGTLGAEVAVAVADAQRGRGIASLLLSALVEHAQEQGTYQFLAATLVAGEAPDTLFKRAGFVPKSGAHEGTVRVFCDLPLQPVA